MKKKRHVPKQKRSAYEDAKAALERAGEDPSAIRAEETASEAADSAEASDAEAAENVEMFDAEAVENAEASDVEGVESAEASDAESAGNAETSDAEAVDSAEASDAESAGNAEASDAEAAENAEASDAETVDSAEASDAAQVPEASGGADSADAIADAIAAAIAGAVRMPETPAPKAADSVPASAAETPEAVPPEPGENMPEAPVAVPETVFSVSATQSDAAQASGGADADYAGSVWDFMEDAEPEFTETEKHAMEIKEITLNARRSPIEDEAEEKEAVKEPKERAAKPRFAAFDRIKDAIRARAEAPEEDGEAPPSGNARDAALHKRVMQIEDEETRNYLLDRVLPQMIWYGKKSAQSQAMYYRFMALSIGLGALIPVCSIGGSHIFFKVVLAVLGASVTAINAYLALHKYQELWISYRSMREELVHTLYSYFNQAGVFAQKQASQEELNVLLVEVCENALSKENGGWTTTVLQKVS